MYINLKISRLLFLLFLIFTSNLFAINYNHNTLDILSKIIPRLVLMSSQKEKLDKTINICIIRKEFDKSVSDTLIEKIKENYPEGINSYSLSFIQTSYKNLNTCKNTHLSFIFDIGYKNINKVVYRLNSFDALTMSYDDSYLKNGVGISLFIGKRVQPYINPKALKNNSIEIDNILLRVSKIYREEK